MTTSMAGSLDCYCLHEILTPDMSAKSTAAAWSSSKNWGGGSYICNSAYAFHDIPCDTTQDNSRSAKSISQYEDSR